MRNRLANALLFLLLAASGGAAQTPGAHAYRGFDRNDYPGDAALPALRAHFRFTSYWLNAPPGETHTTWAGKRALLRRRGFGFLVLFNGRAYAELKGKDAAALGTADGQAAVAAAQREGFAKNVRIFLDQEEGGRLLPAQVAYLFAWIDAVGAAGARAGVYCSGIGVPDGGGGTISTAEDIAQRAMARADASSKTKSVEHRLALWIANDACPPAPGCTLALPALAAALTPATALFARVWQYAQSPRRAAFSAGCPANAAPDGNCYAPGVAAAAHLFVDLNVADTPDPSEGP